MLTLLLCGGGLAAADEPETALDRALSAAREDEGQRNAFYDLFLDTDLYVPMAPGTAEPPEGEERALPAGETIRLFVRDVEGVPTAYAFDTASRLGALRVPELTSYVRAPGSQLVAMLPPEVQVVLNPGASQSKVLTPEELGWLRDRTETARPRAVPEEVEAATAAAIVLLEPRDPPQDVLDALRELLAGRADVAAGWLAHGKPKGSQETPHLVIAIEADTAEAARSVIDEAAALVARALPGDEFADFFVMGKDRLSRSMRKRGEAFYTRGGTR